MRRDLLARAYLDMLAAEAGANSKPMLRGGDSQDQVELLIDELSTVPDSTPRVAIRADIAAVAVLVARSIECVDGLTRDLRRGRPVVSFAVHGAELVALAEQVLEACAFGREATVMDDRSFDSKRARPVLLMARDGTAVDHKAERGNEAIAKALHAGAPIMGVAADPKRHLPRDLLRAADRHLSLGHIDGAAVALVIEAVTGTAPEGQLDEQLVRAVGVSDLVLSIRPDMGADQCLRRLEEIMATKGEFDHRGPRLEELDGYGEEARQWGLNLAADISAFQKNLLDWESVEKGLLLVGPPGTGKTQYARALARSANVALVATSVADWNSASYLSGTLAAIKSSFARARQLAPCVLLIDEIDGISDRSKIADSDYREYWTQIVNLLLELLAGIEDRPGVVVVGCTNHADRIDPAVRRAGRLDRTIEIGLPDVESLARIFRFHLGPKALTDADLMPAALAAAGGTGADVEAWVRRAKSRARRGKRELAMDDVMSEIRSGRPALPERLRHVCAFHEAGHLVVGLALEVFEPTALAIADDGGATRVEISLKNSQSEAGIENYISALLAGRAAELVVLGPNEATAGSGVGGNSDFARATEAAVDLELRYGFGILGVAQFSDRVTDLLLHDPSIVGLVKARLDRCLERAKRIVADNRRTLEAVATRLEERGYLGKTEIEKVIEEHPIAAVDIEDSPQRRDYPGI